MALIVLVGAIVSGCQSQPSTPPPQTAESAEVEPETRPELPEATTVEASRESPSSAGGKVTAAPVVEASGGSPGSPGTAEPASAAAEPSTGSGASRPAGERGAGMSTARKLQSRAREAERRGEPGKAFAALAEALVEARAGTGPEAASLAAEIEAELRQLRQKANRDATGQGAGSRRDVPLISR